MIKLTPEDTVLVINEVARLVCPELLLDVRVDAEGEKSGVIGYVQLADAIIIGTEEIEAETHLEVKELCKKLLRAKTLASLWRLKELLEKSIDRLREGEESLLETTSNGPR